MVSALGHAVRGWRPPGGRHVRTFTSLSAAGLVEAVVSSLNVIVLVRLAGTENSGQVIFAQSLATVLFLLCDPRLENAAQRFVPVEQLRSGRGSALFVRLLRWDAAIGLASTGVVLAGVLAARLEGFATGEFASMLALAVVARGVTASNGTAGAGFALADRLRAYGTLRVRCAVLSFGLSSGGLLAGGPIAYLLGQVAGALVSAVVLSAAGTRALLAELGPETGPGTGPETGPGMGPEPETRPETRPARARVPLPAGLVAFTLKASVGTSVAEVSDSGLLTVAGIAGGPALVTVVKVASAPGRLYAALTMPVASMLYPRLARAAALEDHGTLIRRDVVRATRILAGAAAAALAVALPFTGEALRLVYGPEYAGIGTVAVLLTAAACVRTTVCWSNALALAVGRPGWRLGYLSAEVTLLLGALLAAGLAAPDTVRTALGFAWGSLALAVLGAGIWLAVLRRITGGPPAVPGGARGREGL
ncbi:hypothetical protein [Streptosporangium sp. NPDC002524]|uniref:lipopolysaccharide biosynthesis protein n=1 Tax=Streptosporangium sp. NPDC002524 TaxID=3154537 RepID=UPI00331DC93D